MCLNNFSFSSSHCLCSRLDILVSPVLCQYLVCEDVLFIFLQLFADLRCSPSCARAGVQGTVSICPPDCFQYKGTLDVFHKIIRQVGILYLLSHF